MSAVAARPPSAAVWPSPLKPCKASQLVTLLAGTGRPRLDWAWVRGGGNPDLHGAAGSATQAPGDSLSTGNAFIPDASKGRVQLPPAGRHKDRFPTWIPPNAFIPSSLVCQEYACLQSCFLTIPSFWNATSPSLSLCCHSFQLRSRSPRTSQPWEAPPSLDSPSTYCLSLSLIWHLAWTALYGGTQLLASILLLLD